MNVDSGSTGTVNIRGRILLALALLAAATMTAIGLMAPSSSDAAKKSATVKVMTRNVYLGADLADAIAATSSAAFFQANGAILRQVDGNAFPVRAKGLAGEIRSKMPDLVGLQEVAKWSIGPPNLAVINDPSQSTATTVKYDYLEELMAEINKGKKLYKVIKVTEEFDFEAPANYEETYPDVNGRLTMRDVIIARTSNVRTRKPKGGNYSTLFRPVVSGIQINVARGWNSVEARVGNSPWFTFVNTHLEAFGDDKNGVVDCMTKPAPAYATNQVSIRCLQAKELYNTVIKKSKLPVIAVGDFNSDDRTVVDANCPSAANKANTLVGGNGGLCGDTFAYNALKKLGMRNVSTYKPLSCCLNTPDLIAADGGGSRSDFDTHIDHILTDQPAKKVKLVGSAVTGLSPENGYWNSDHAGVFSKLKMQG